MTNSVTEIFRNAIAEKFHLSNKDDILYIEEKRNAGKSLTTKKDKCLCEWVKISIRKIDYFCFSIDHDDTNGQDTVFPFFNTKENRIKGLRSKNDAILICQKESKIYIFLIELKSNNTGNGLKQLQLSRLFIDFIIDRFNAVNSGYKISKEDIEYRGILFSSRTTKGTSRKKPKFYMYRDISLAVADETCQEIYPLEYFLT